jgi:hypothetical protein
MSIMRIRWPMAEWMSFPKYNPFLGVSTSSFTRRPEISLDGGREEEAIVAMAPDLRSVESWDDFIREYSEDRETAKAMYRRARRFLESFAWCGGIEKAYVGLLQFDIVGVFLFKIHPTKPEVDEWLWVVVGDLPSAYLVCDNSPNPVLALQGYIEEMSRWVDAVEKGRPVDDLIPTRVDPTPKYAQMLKIRLEIIEEYLMREFGEVLKDAPPFD